MSDVREDLGYRPTREARRRDLAREPQLPGFSFTFALETADGPIPCRLTVLPPPPRRD